MKGFKKIQKLRDKPIFWNKNEKYFFFLIAIGIRNKLISYI